MGAAQVGREGPLGERRRATVTTPITAEPGVVQLTRDEGRALVDQEVRRVLGIDVDELIRRFDAGELNVDDEDILDLVMLLPFAR
jgi:hypothetical protein